MKETQGTKNFKDAIVAWKNGELSDDAGMYTEMLELLYKKLDKIGTPGFEVTQLLTGEHSEIADLQQGEDVLFVLGDGAMFFKFRK